MRISEVYLDGFGVFHDQRITISSKSDGGGRASPGNQGVVLFTGANEAGKTTLMSFIRGVLFGFEGEASRSFYAPERGGRHGGNLLVEMLDGRVERIMRYAERGQSRQPAAAVGNMSKALYTNVFAFGLSELALLSSLGSDEVRSRIYSAGAGLGTRSLPEARRKLESKCDSLYKPRGRTPMINMALAKADELDRRMANLGRDTSEHARLISAIEQCRASHAQVQASLREASAAQYWYASLDSTRLVWERLVQAMAAEERLGPEDQSCKGLLQQAGAIRELQLKLDTYLSVAASIPGLRAEADAMRADHWRLLIELGTGWDEASVSAFDTSPGVDETVRQMRKVRDSLAGTVERSEEALAAREEAAEAAARQHDRLSQELSFHPGPDYPDRAAIVSRIERIGKCQSLLLSVAAAAAKAEAAEERSSDLSHEADESAKAATQARSFGHIWLAPALIGVGSILAALARPAWAALLIIVAGAAAGIAIARSALRRSKDADLAARDAKERARQAQEHEEQLAAAHREAAGQLEAAKADLEKGEADPRRSSRRSTEDEAALAALMERARQDLADWDAYLRIQRDLEEAASELKRREKDMDTARKALDNARTALEAEDDRWRAWLSSRGIDRAFSYDGALQTIDLIRKAKDARERLAQAERRAAAAQERAQEYEHAVHSVLAALEVPSEDENRRDCEAQSEASKRPMGPSDCRAAVDRLVAFSAEAQELVDTRRRLASEVEDLAAQLDSVFPAPDRARARADHASHTQAQIQAALEEAGKRAEALQAKAGELDRELGSLGQSKETLENRDELAHVGAQRAAVQGELDAWLREWAACCVCLDLVNSACEKYERERQPQVLQDASAALGKMTGGRWPRIIARVAGLESLDVVGSDGMVRPHTRLSCGTEQQLYLAVRCGLVREYCSHAEPMPVMVDDVLVNFDLARSAAAARVLAQLSDVCQVLVFTCHAHTAEHFRQTGLVTAEFALETPGEAGSVTVETADGGSA